MSETANAIMDAAELRIQKGGYGSFSFRELAADVGVKSSSVHYHFPTKENLAAAVTRRYAERCLDSVDEQIKAGGNPKKVWRDLFRTALVGDARMCLCGALGASAPDLPPEVVAESRTFFRQAIQRLVEAGVPRDSATQLMATLEGAQILANTLDDVTVFDAATASFGA